MKLLAAACVLLPPLCSCGSTRYGVPWGEGATLAPGSDRLLQAARDAALDPVTWAPLAGAALLTIGDADENLSDWAREETPVFGSTSGAESASDDWRGYSQDAWLLSMVFVPSGDQAQYWLRNKAQGYVVQWSATWVVSELTSIGKSAFDRERPDGSDNRSMPSGHTSAAFAYTTLARRNVDAMLLPDAARVSLDVALLGLAAGTGWARVEAGAHYPTDVLVGAALGNFVARFIDDAFLDVEGAARLTAYVDPAGGEWSVGLAWSY